MISANLLFDVRSSWIMKEEGGEGGKKGEAWRTDVYDMFACMRDLDMDRGVRGFAPPYLPPRMTENTSSVQKLL